MGVTIPATGTGDTTPVVATDKIAGVDYQQVKIVDGTIGGSRGAIVDTNGALRVSVGSTPGSLVGASISNLPVTQPVSGSVSVVNFPATQPVSIASIAGTAGQIGASVSNFPATQAISGFVGASVSGGLVGASISGGLVGASVSNAFAGASISNFPTTQPVSIASVAAGLGPLGASVSNFPTLFGASVSNTPTVSIASSSVQIGASISNLPAIQGASVSNFPANQPVSGSITAYPAAATTGGASPLHFITGASVNNVLVKNAAGTIYTIAAMNVNANPRYVKLYDKSTTPSVGADTPVQTYIVPGNTSGAGAVIPIPVGLLFAAGIGFGITAGSMGDTDSTVTALGDVVLNLGFK